MASTRRVSSQEAQRGGLGLGAVVLGQHDHGKPRPVQADVGGGVGVALQAAAGDAEGGRVGRRPVADGRSSVAVEREGQHGGRSGVGEGGRADRSGRGPVVDGDEADPVSGRSAVHDGGQAAPDHGVEDRVVVGGGPQHDGVHGRLSDPAASRGPPVMGMQGQAEPVFDADRGDAGQELCGLRVVEGVGQVLTEDDAQVGGAPAAQ